MEHGRLCPKIFVHLHVHSEFSLLDGACRIEQMPQYAQQMGQQALAITDHGVMYGCIDFYKACQKAGVRPIIGCEVHVAPRTRFDKRPELDGEAYHLVLLCENQTGYQNLIYLVSMAFTEGFYNKPRVDWELLCQHHEGLICLSACLAGEIPQLLRQGDYEGARQRAAAYRDLFGPQNYFLEVQDHGIAEQKLVDQDPAAGGGAGRRYGGYQRRPLPAAAGCPDPGCADVYPDGQDGGRPEPDAV